MSVFARFVRERSAARRAALRDAPRMFANVAPFVAPAGMPLLTKLDLTDSGGGAGGAVLPWVDLMAKCPAMRELRLNGLGGAQGWEPKPRLGSSNDPFGNPSADAAAFSVRCGNSPFRVSTASRFWSSAPRVSRRPQGTTSVRPVSVSAYVSDGFRVAESARARRHRRARIAVSRRHPSRTRRSFRDTHAFGDRAGHTRRHALLRARRVTLRVLRCARTGWAGGGGLAADGVRAAFFVESSDDALPGAPPRRPAPRFPDLRVLEPGRTGAQRALGSATRTR